jgi:anti-sigma B factor antagonist
MDISVRKTGDVTIVDFNGRLAAGVSDSVLPKLIVDILGDGSKKILLNLSDMDYIDSNGLGELVQAFREAQRNDASLRLLKPQDRVAKTLRLTNLLPMFAVCTKASGRRSRLSLTDARRPAQWLGRVRGARALLRRPHPSSFFARAL